MAHAESHALTGHEQQKPDDVSEVNLILTDLAYFVDEGLGKLLRAMLRQSLKDILHDRKDPRAPAEVSASARWPQSDDGIRCIEFLMPSMSPSRVVARIYSDTEQMLDAFERAEVERTTRPDTGYYDADTADAEQNQLPRGA